MTRRICEPSQQESATFAFLFGLRRALGPSVSMDILQLHIRDWGGLGGDEGTRLDGVVFLAGQPSAGAFQAAASRLKAKLPEGHALVSLNVLSEEPRVRGTFVRFEATTSRARQDGLVAVRLSTAPPTRPRPLLAPLKALLRWIRTV